MSCFLQCLGCSFWSYPCFFLCTKKCKESSTTRFMYTLFFIFAVAASLVSHERKLIVTASQDTKIQKFCQLIDAGAKCQRLLGYIGVYRICIPVFVFHLFLCLITICVTTSGSWRGKIHNGFWIWKIIVLVGIWNLLYFIDRAEKATRVWMIFGIVGGLIFVYIQHVTLIDFAYEFNIKWSERSKENKCFLFLIYLLTFLLYAFTFTAYGFLIFYFGWSKQCSLNLTLCMINAGFTLLLFLFSCVPRKLRERHLWMPGAVTGAFVVFLTFLALNNQPKILLSDSPWRHRAPSQPDVSSTLSPKLLAIYNLNSVLTDQSERPTVAGLSSKNFTPIINQCLPPALTKLSNDIVGGGTAQSNIIIGVSLFIVIGGSLYSSIRATMQGKRMGIETKGEKLKQLLSNTDAPPDGAKNTPLNVGQQRQEPNDSNQNGPSKYLKRHDVKRQGITPEDEERGKYGPREGQDKKSPSQIRFALSEPELNQCDAESAAAADGPTGQSPRRQQGQVARRARQVEQKRERRMSKDEKLTSQIVALSQQDHPTDNVQTTNRLLPPDAASNSTSLVDLSSGSSPNKWQYDKARELGSLVVGKRGQRLIWSQPDLLPSLAFIRPLMKEAAPSDGFTKLNEYIATSYSYAWFHFVYAIATLYLMTQLTNWYNPQDSSFEQLSGSWANFWMKVVSSWIALALYGWTIMAPRLCVCRQLINTPLTPMTSSNATKMAPVAIAIAEV